MPSILEGRLLKDRRDLREAEERVERMPAIKPSKDEVELSDNIVRTVSEMFANRIATEGITDAVKNSITQQVEKEVTASCQDYDERSRVRRLVLTSMYGLGPL